MAEVARDGKVHVLSEQCSTCIFRPGNLMHLERGRRAEMARESCENDSAITCHDTLPYGRFGATAKPAICRGFYDRYADRVVSLRLARMMGLVKEVDPPEKEND